MVCMFARKDSGGSDRIAVGPEVIRLCVQEVGDCLLGTTVCPGPDLGKRFEGDARAFCQFTERHSLPMDLGGD